MPEFRPFIDLGALSPSNSFRLLTPNASDYSLSQISVAGDVNGDGFGDLIAGAPRANNNGTYSGSAFVIFGSAEGFASEIQVADLDGSDGLRIDGAAAENVLGLATLAAGDVNGDGIDDIALKGAAGDDSVFYVLFGSTGAFPATVADIDGSNGFKITGVNDTRFVDVSAAGDVNGDGFDDIIIGSQLARTHGNDRSGAVYVVFGKAAGCPDTIDISDLDGSNGFRISGRDAYDYLGVRVTGVGDVNGDGFDDVMITDAPYGGGTTSYVVFGKETGFRSNFNLDNLNGRNGFAFINAGTKYDSDFIAAAGDVNGDGFDDIIVGNDASFGNAGIGYTGSAAVIFGKAGGFSTVINASDFTGKDGFQITGESHYSYIGSTVSTAGDVNGDGFDDVLVSAFGIGPSAKSFSFVVFGKATGFDRLLQLQDIDGSNGFRIQDLDFFSVLFSVLPGGDIDHDGFDDLIATGADGASHIIYGHRALDAVTRIGTAIDNTINGGRGADVIRGLGGNDHLIGWEKADHIFGGAGGDRLAGRTGHDILDGGTGRDVLIGGFGDDIFDYNSVSDSANAAPDVIRDFHHGMDAIDLSAFGDLDFVGTAQFTGSGEVRAIQSGSDVLVKINLSGVDTAEMTIVLRDVQASSLTAGDFII
jgi:hypothetical protein